MLDTLQHQISVGPELSRFKAIDNISTHISTWFPPEMCKLFNTVIGGIRIMYEENEEEYRNSFDQKSKKYHDFTEDDKQMIYKIIGATRGGEKSNFFIC